MVLGEHPPAVSRHLGAARGTLDAFTGDCGNYCSLAGCSWTLITSCPWMAEPGTHGRSRDDGSTGYHCCCTLRTATTQPCGGPVSADSRRLTEARDGSAIDASLPLTGVALAKAVQSGKVSLDDAIRSGHASLVSRTRAASVR